MFSFEAGDNTVSDPRSAPGAALLQSTTVTVSTQEDIQRNEMQSNVHHRALALEHNHDEEKKKFDELIDEGTVATGAVESEDYDRQHEHSHLVTYVDKVDGRVQRGESDTATAATATPTTVRSARPSLKRPRGESPSRGIAGDALAIVRRVIARGLGFGLANPKRATTPSEDVDVDEMDRTG